MVRLGWVRLGNRPFKRGFGKMLYLSIWIDSKSIVWDFSHRFDDGFIVAHKSTYLT